MKTTEQVRLYLATEIESISLGRLSAAAVTGEERIIQDLGFDSLDYATLMLACESWSGVKLSEQQIDWALVQTVNQLADLFIIHANASS